MTTRACMPMLPSLVITGGDKELLVAPVADFLEVLRRIGFRANVGICCDLAEGFGLVSAGYGVVQTDEADVGDLRKAAQAKEASQARAFFAAVSMEAWRKTVRNAKGQDAPAGLPEEFADYERGAALYHAGDLAGARTAWEKLLALPASDRKWRTIWATYMIGRTYSNADPVQAQAFFSQVRALAAQGFADTVGLAATSLGWEAQAELKQGHRSRAVDLYLQQLAAGDESGGWSLRDIAAATLAGSDAQMAEAANDPATRTVVAAYLVARGGPPTAAQPEATIIAQTHQWLHIMEAVGTPQMPAADLLAWAAYQSDEATAARWLKFGRTESGIGQWIQAKLYSAPALFKKPPRASPKPPPRFLENEEWENVATVDEWDSPWSPHSHVPGRSCADALGRGEFTQTLDLLLKAGFWEDSAYIAERVLTPDELKSYVDRHYPNEPAEPPPPTAVDPREDSYLPKQGDPVTQASEIRGLLSASADAFGYVVEEARLYFQPHLLPMFDAYIEGLRAGADIQLSKAERATSLWQSAKLAHSQGMELLGTEVEPDMAIYDGSFGSVVSAARIN